MKICLKRQYGLDCVADGSLEELEWFLLSVHKQTHCFNHAALIVFRSSALCQYLWQLVQL